MQIPSITSHASFQASPVYALGKAALTVIVLHILSKILPRVAAADYYTCRSNCFSLITEDQRCSAQCEVYREPNPKWDALIEAEKTGEIDPVERARLAGYKACVNACVMAFPRDTGKIKYCMKQC